MNKNQILILNGPNLNMLGIREQEIYGKVSLKDLEIKCMSYAKNLNFKLTFKQSNYEGELIKWIQNARNVFSTIIINAGAYTHTSIAIRDALIMFNGLIYEVHISNIYKREEYRHHSYISSLARGVICGAGILGYEIAIDAAKNYYPNYMKKGTKAC